MQQRRIIAVTPAHVAFMDDLKGVITRHQHLSAAEMLALTSQLVGIIVASQDQRTTTPEMAMRMVSSNIERGNQMAVSDLMHGETAGSA